MGEIITDLKEMGQGVLREIRALSGSTKFWCIVILAALICVGVYHPIVPIVVYLLTSLISLGYLEDFFNGDNEYFWVLITPWPWLFIILMIIIYGIIKLWEVTFGRFNKWLDEKF